MLNQELRSHFKFGLLVCQERSSIFFLGGRKQYVWVPPNAGVGLWTWVCGEAHSGTVANILVGELWQSHAADEHLFQVVLSLRVLFRKYLNSFVFIE